MRHRARGDLPVSPTTRAGSPSWRLCRRMARNSWSWRQAAGCERSPFALLWQAVCPAPWSTRAVCAASPRRWVFWRRPTASMPPSSPALAGSSGCGRPHCRARPGSGSRPWSHGFARSPATSPSTSSAARACVTMPRCPPASARCSLSQASDRRLEGEIASLIEDDPLWARSTHAFRSIKGVADRTVARLLAQLPEIGTSPTRPSPNWPAWPRLPMTAASAGRAAMRGGRAGPAPSCSSSPRSPPSTTPASSPSVQGCK